MTILLDTSVLIDVLNDRNGRRELLVELLDAGHILACCAVTIAEVYAGMRPNERKQTEEFLASLEYAETGRATAQRAGLLKAAWTKKGTTLSLPDVLIAAVAIENEYALATDNRKHFPMTELELLPLT